ncbi:MAG: ATPase [Firmicutes bacterium]|jgi:N-acetylglucosamine kinase-like BadF-type ATPase|nr:ATPase [Bacillota bacterium]
MYYLGVDGGGTKTAFMLITDNGEILGYEVKGTCHYLQVGLDVLREVLTTGISDLLQKTSVPLSSVKFAFLGIPGYGEMLEYVPLVENIVAEVLGTVQFRCGNDVEAGWAGSLACKPGINLVGGTGAIGFGKDQNGNTARASGWGEFCGDEGSAYWLGRQLISLFGKQADGREERTQLYQIVRERFNLKRDLDLIRIIMKDLGARREEIARLALLLYEAAEQGDPKAKELYRKAAEEYALIVKAIIKKLNFDPREDVLVSYSGGVFKAGEYILSPLRELIGKSDCKLVEPRLTPITGAALYALHLSRKPYDSRVVERLASEEPRFLGD